jgi:hypothetical protein
VVGGDAAEPRDAGAVGPADGSVEPPADAIPPEGPANPGLPPECTTERQVAAVETLRKRVEALDPCFSGSVTIMEDTPESRDYVEGSGSDELTWRVQPDGRIHVYRFETADYGGGFGFRVCRDAPEVRKKEERLAGALAGETFPCIDPGGTSVGVSGGAQEDLVRVTRTAGRCGQYSRWGQEDLRVVLDGAGAVADVRGGEGENATELRRCVREALHDLVFPCLADFELCPEYVIIE